jgi:MFS family permease
MITYLDRVCIASAAPHMVKALGLRNVRDLNLAFTAFAFAYAIFEIPTGWLGDVFGPRSTLIRIVLWWSLFTALTGLVALTLPGGITLGLTALVVIRFLFGVGEAGAYPNITRALHNWFPFTERGAAQGTVWMSGRLMGGLTPLVLLVLVEGLAVEGSAPGAPDFLVAPLLSWREAFWLFGGLGVIWCLLFALWFRNRPEEKATVNEAERAIITSGRHDVAAAHAGVHWLKLLKSRNLWYLCLMYFCASYGWYFNITYLPSFLGEQYGVRQTSLSGALYKGGPLWMGALACLAGGFLTDRFIRRTGNRKWGRRLFGVVGHGLCALCFLACVFIPKAPVALYTFLFFLAISLAAFWNDMTMGSAWATCQDIGRRHAAIVAGCMNTIGNLGGAAAGYLTGEILKASAASYVAAQPDRLTSAPTHLLVQALGAQGVAPAGAPLGALTQQVSALGVTQHLTSVEMAAANLPGYQFNLLSFFLVYVAAALLWLWIDSTRPVFPEDDLSPGAPAA